MNELCHVVECNWTNWTFPKIVLKTLGYERYIFLKFKRVFLYFLNAREKVRDFDRNSVSSFSKHFEHKYEIFYSKRFFILVI